MELGPDSPWLDYTQVIIHEADRLQALVDRLLAPHQQALRAQSLNIHEVLERVRTLVQAEFGPGLKVDRDYDTSLPDLTGDPEVLIQVLLNIVRNAAQALESERGAGRARIGLRTRVARHEVIGKRRHRLALEVQVQDNGPGVPPELEDRLFLPLVTGRAQGTGMGLTLAQAGVLQHGGSLRHERRAGLTVFTLLLPLP
jgi:two-component system nitrogen regulation sensor histidine kinase GlnL